MRWVVSKGGEGEKGFPIGGFETGHWTYPVRFSRTKSEALYIYRMPACLLCKKEYTWVGIRKHLFSGFHAQEIIDSITSKKVVYAGWLARYDANPQACPFPKLYLCKESNVNHDFCYPCKRFRDVRTNRPIECNEAHKKESAEFIRQCLGQVNRQESEKVKKLQAELAELKGRLQNNLNRDIPTDVGVLNRHIARLKLQVATLEEDAEHGQALYSLLTHYHTKNPDLYNTMMGMMKVIDSSVHSRLIKQFEEEE